MATRPSLKRVAVSKLREAPWNFKVGGDTELFKRFVASVEHDKSAGVMAVRVVRGGYEVIDGNHRLKAILALGWKTAVVEDFGEMSESDAQFLSWRRNQQWFPDDLDKLATLSSLVLKEIPASVLDTIGPLGAREYKELSSLANVHWAAVAGLAPADDTRSEIIFKVTRDQRTAYEKLRARLVSELAIGDDVAVFFAIVILAKQQLYRIAKIKPEEKTTVAQRNILRESIRGAR